MSKIDELIRELCPDGVEYKELGELISLNFGDRITRTEDGGKLYPVYGGGGESFRTDRYNRENEYIVSRFAMSAKCVRKVSGKFWMLDSGFTFNTTSSSLDKNYIAYWLFNNQRRIYACSSQGAQKNLKTSNFKKFRVPVPPLEVQQEIVRVLDSFAELETELETELEARRKQYEYYRDELLFSDYGTQRMNLDELCNMKAGKAISATAISAELSDERRYPCYGGNGLRGYVKEPNHNGSFVLVGRQGALCGNVCYTTGEFYATEHAVVVSPKKQIDIRYLFHLLEAADLNQYKTAGAQPGLSVAKLKEVAVPVKNMEEQHRIVSILDKFDALVNDIYQGLPAEIEARRKQYEYYRDELLAFKELPA